MINAQDQEAKKISRDRSTAYPGIPLRQALEIVGKLAHKYGEAPFSRDDAAQTMDYKGVSGASAKKIAALVHYGLTKRMGSAYQITSLASRILYPFDDADKQGAVEIAARNPKLFAALIAKFAGKALPANLTSILIRDHGINRKVADQVAKVFKTSLTDAGLYNNGIITAAPDDSDGEQPADTAPSFSSGDSMTANTPSQKPNYEQAIQPGMQRVNLPSGVIILYPESLSYFFATGMFAEPIGKLNQLINEALPEINEASTSE